MVNASAMQELGLKARKAAGVLALASTQQKNAALKAMAKAIRAAATGSLLPISPKSKLQRPRILKDSFIDRLTLTTSRVEAMAKGLEDIAGLPDPVGTTLANGPVPTA